LTSGLVTKALNFHLQIEYLVFQVLYLGPESQKLVAYFLLVHSIKTHPLPVAPVHIGICKESWRSLGQSGFRVFMFKSTGGTSSQGTTGNEWSLLRDRFKMGVVMAETMLSLVRGLSLNE
jgi:hypothetical protein